MSRSIEFRIKDGKVTSKAIGFTGSACETEIKKLIAGLGETTDSEHILPDFYEQDIDNNQTVEGV